MGRIKKIFSKAEPKVKEAAQEQEIPKAEAVEEPIEEILLEDLGVWVKKRELEILGKDSLEPELTNYIGQLKESGMRVDQQLNVWLTNLDLSKLRYTTVGEINLLFSDAQTIVKLINTQQAITLGNVSRFNLILKEKVRKLMEKMGSGAINEELSELLGCHDIRAGEEAFSPNPLWKDLVELNNLRESFGQKVNSSNWQRISMLRRLHSLLLEAKQNVGKLQERIKTNQYHLKLTSESLAEKEGELALLRKESGFNELEEREEALKEISPQFEQAKQKVILFFSPLKPYLQQCRGLNPDNSMIEDYLSNYVNAFYEDEMLMIITILRKLRMSLEEGKVSIEERDRNLLLDRVEQGNSGELRELHREFCKLRKSMLEKEQHVNRALSMKFEDVKYRLDHFQAEAKKLNAIISELEQEITKNSDAEQKAKEKFKSLAKEYFGKSVELKIS